jgi:hypothetical protein
MQRVNLPLVITGGLPLTRSNRAYLEHYVADVERLRSEPVSEADVKQIVADMHSDDAMTRARAVRQIYPCRMPWSVFYRLRKAAKCLQSDPSPLVRAYARHIEDDAKIVESLESELEQVREYEEGLTDPSSHPDRQNWRRTRKRNLRAQRRFLAACYRKAIAVGSQRPT